MHNNLIHLTVQTFCCHLWQNRVTPCSHIWSTNQETVESIIVHFNSNRCCIYSGNTWALHCHCHTDTSDFSISHITAREFFIPFHHFFCLFHTLIQGTAVCRLPVICRHYLPLTNHIFLTQRDRIHIHFFCQLIDCRLYCKQALCCTISTISTGWHYIRVYHVISKTECFRLPVQRNRFVTGKSNCCRSVFPKRSCIGKRIDIYSLNNSVFISSKTDMNLHLMPRRGCNHRFFSCKNHLCRFSRFPCYQCRINFWDNRLFCPETASDPWLDHTNLRLWNIQCICKNPPYMERNLCGRKDIQSSIRIQICICSECFHHCLLVCLCMIHLINDILTVCQNRFYISLFTAVMCTEISLVVCPYRTQTLPVFFRMHQNRIVFGFMKIKYRL